MANDYHYNHLEVCSGERPSSSSGVGDCKNVETCKPLDLTIINNCPSTTRPCTRFWGNRPTKRMERPSSNFIEGKEIQLVQMGGRIELKPFVPREWWIPFPIACVDSISRETGQKDPSKLNSLFHAQDFENAAFGLR